MYIFDYCTKVFSEQTVCLRIVYALFTQELGSEQNFQQLIGKFVVYHFYHIFLFCCIAKSIYSAIPYDFFVYDGCAHGNLTDFSIPYKLSLYNINPDNQELTLCVHPLLQVKTACKTL